MLIESLTTSYKNRLFLPHTYYDRITQSLMVYYITYLFLFIFT